ncbi:MAG: phosphate ABC transporter substrate-binding protein PstS [Rhizomicrobium sp.]
MWNRIRAPLGALGVAALVLAGCHRSGQANASAGADISGAGATFPAPIYEKWAQAYKAGGGAELNYQAIGSGGGIRQIESKTVDFGASDKPLRQDDLEKNGLMQFPTVIGGVVPVVNLPGVTPGLLHLTGPVLAAIYQGAITRWSAPEIHALNPAVALPDLPISVVHRADGSGTTFLYTSYLGMVSPAWAQKVGASDGVAWPTGQGGKGNDGVAAMVRQTAGSIGYVEYAYAAQSTLAYASMQNHDGRFIAPTAASFAAAAAAADWSHAPGFYLLLLDQPGANSWPITGATFILMDKRQSDPARAAGVLKFFDWAYRNGDRLAAGLGYVPLPAGVKTLVRRAWASEIAGPEAKPVYVSK